MNNDKNISTGSITLSIKGKPLKIDLRAPAKPVTARRMLPVFRDITNSFVQFGVDGAIAEGKEISCKAGCGACCRQPVPISEAEAFDLSEYVQSLPKEKRAEIEERFSKAVAALKRADWLTRLDKLPPNSTDARRELVLEYFGWNLACPFLENESCSIHQTRPLSCREYLVTSPAKNCSQPTPERIETVDLPATPSRIYREITAAKAPTGKSNYLPLVLALDFAGRNKEESERKTGEKWISIFFGTMANPAKKTAEEDR